MVKLDWCEQSWPEVVARAVLDKDFRLELAKNPEKTIKLVGIEVKREELEAIKKLKMQDWDKMTLSAVNDRIGRLAGHKITRVIVTE